MRQSKLLSVYKFTFIQYIKRLHGYHYRKKHTVKKALSMGFEKVLDDRGYDSGAYYVKDGKSGFLILLRLSKNKEQPQMMS
ncbi:hypothetical protein OIU82_20355 [Escherichia coli]|nr:hypothetical protein [Escherichia coli]